MTEQLATARADADRAVDTAEQEAREAAGLVAALEERVRDGDDSVTPEQIASARELGSFARLRADATARKAADAKRAARLAACQELRAEIDAHHGDNGDQAAKLLDKAYAALTAYADHVETHNRRVIDWRARMVELGIPAHNAPILAPAEHAGLGYQGEELIAGNLTYRRVPPWPALDELVKATKLHADARPKSRTAAAETVAAVKKRVQAIRPRPLITPGQVHYRGPSGGVFSYDPDRVPSDEDIRRLGLVPVSAEEAYAA